jgi:DNA-binding NarL/FixJ family response regulator
MPSRLRSSLKRVGRSSSAEVMRTVQRLANRSSASRRRAATTEQLTLSTHEREVLYLLQEGQSVPAIAAGMFISLSTAKTYVARLYKKLGATNRATALMSAVRRGLVKEPALIG